ncbi:DUF4381 domain-containing protein [Mariprofundus erugo]|uniref:DUF4381 domain-containing protein n=1 Tax=Mariprofundus erugo TaxID=2528639 RepID=A0A5R9GV85_9PROT|nr:DUF4381 domain-containing protein [Mariprofundus erugo]TLS67922.1 DUF4381 domain-containing protein [Mariprofundus erugo]
MKPDALSALHDIHLPPAVSWWPPAPGWWGLLVMVLLLVGTFAWLMYRRYHSAEARSRRLRRAMLAAAASELVLLQQQPDAELIAELSMLLRRVAVQLEPDVAGISGDRWLAWLDGKWDRDDFSAGYGRLMIEAPYRPNVAIDGDQLITLCQQWLDAQR